MYNEEGSAINTVIYFSVETWDDGLPDLVLPNRFFELIRAILLASFEDSVKPDLRKTGFRNCFETKFFCCWDCVGCV